MFENIKHKILVVDDDPGHRAALKTLLRSMNYQVTVTDDGSKAVELIKRTDINLVMMDVRMLEMDGIKAMTLIKQYNPKIPVIIMTAYSSVEAAVEAMKAGAYDYLTKPLDFDALRITLEKALEHTRLNEENRLLRNTLQRDLNLNVIIGKSKAIKELKDMIAMVAPSEATVLITGESGTGKELVAKAIHALSRRHKKPLVTVNCAALSDTLLESELFGHEKGAFTGADKRREGLFIHANGGTVFLDEIGEMSSKMQAKLLRVIQNREIQRVGSNKTIYVDVRIIAATNRDLDKEVSSGRFREDLYYRLNVVLMRVPSLKERTEDIPILAQYFLDKFAEKNQKKVKGFTPLAMDILMNYHWPGNVREMRNTIERATIVLREEYITEKELPPNITQTFNNDKKKTHFYVSTDKVESLKDIEKKAILAALKASDGNKSKAARKLKITRKTLYKKLKEIGVQQN